jgi:hypothetical protein
VTWRVADPSSRTSSGSSARRVGATSRVRAQGCRRPTTQHQLVHQARGQAFLVGSEPVPAHDREVQLVGANGLLDLPEVGDPFGARCPGRGRSVRRVRAPVNPNQAATTPSVDCQLTGCLGHPGPASPGVPRIDASPALSADLRA